MNNQQILTYLAGIVALLGLVGIAVYIGGTDPKTGFPDPITVNGETINFTWTDDNTGETLEIYTDKKTYSDSLASADVYVAVANRSGVAQEIELMGYFRNGKKTIKDISVLTSQTRSVDNPIMETVCVEDKSTTSPVCTEEQVSLNSYQVTENKWVPLPLIERTDAEVVKEIIALKADLVDEVQIIQEVLVDTPIETPVEEPTIIEEVIEIITEEIVEPVIDIVIPEVEAGKVSKITEQLVATHKTKKGFIAERKSSPFSIPADGVVYYKVHIEFPKDDADNFYFEAIGSEGAWGWLDPWFNSAWAYRVPVNVVPSRVGSSTAVTNFPVYVDLAGMPSTFWTLASSTGADIRVTKSDGNSEVAFELVSFATTTQRGELHFLADTLGTTSTSTFFIYYGNPNASAYANNATFGRNNVWTGYLAVYHDASTTDSTGNYDVTNTGVTFSAGKIGNGADFNATTDKLENTNTIFDFQPTQAYSVSMWVDLVSVGTNQMLVTNQVEGGDFQGWGIFQTSGGIIAIDMVQDLAPVSYYGVRTPALSIGTAQTHVVFTKSSSTAVSGANIYIDGVNQSLTTVLDNLTGTITYGSDLRQGNRGDTYNMNGQLDEVRIRSGVKTDAAWVITEYNNQFSTSTFMTIGAQEINEVATFPASSISGGTIMSSGIIQ